MHASSLKQLCSSILGLQVLVNTSTHQASTHYPAPTQSHLLLLRLLGRRWRQEGVEIQRLQLCPQGRILRLQLLHAVLQAGQAVQPALPASRCVAGSRNKPERKRSVVVVGTERRAALYKQLRPGVVRSQPGQWTWYLLNSHTRQLSELTWMPLQPGGS